MKFSRLTGLNVVVLCLLCPLSGILNAQQNPPAPAKPKPGAQNPFETVPTAQEPEPAKPSPAKPTQQPFERPPEAAEPAKPVTPADSDVIADIEFRGSRRVPQDTLRALIITRRGDKFNEESLTRDFMALWNTQRFDDIRLEKERGNAGWIIRFVLTERRVVRSIKYEGAKSVTVSEILDRFKERKVGLSVESQYDPNKVQRASDRPEGIPCRARPSVRDRRAGCSSDSAVVARSHVQGQRGSEGQGRQHRDRGNKVFSDREVIRAMRNLRPIGIPHSILFENLFCQELRRQQARRGQGPHPQLLSGERVLHCARRGARHEAARRRRHRPPHPAVQTEQAGQACRPHAHRRRRPAIQAQQDQLRRRQAVPDARLADASAVPDAGRRRLLHRQAAQGHGEPAQALRRVRLHRFRAGARAGADCPVPTRST